MDMIYKINIKKAIFTSNISTYLNS